MSNNPIIPVVIPVVLPNDDGIRPARKSDECFYCQQKVGTSHHQDCVAIHKKVLVRAIVEYEIEVPYSWDKEQIEFQRNEGSWCASNMLQELENLDTDEHCLCPNVTYEFVSVTVPGPYGKEQ